MSSSAKHRDGTVVTEGMQVVMVMVMVMDIPGE